MHPLDKALTHSKRGELDKAERILRKLPQDDLRVQFNLGWYDIRKGRLLKGMEGMAAGRWLNVFGSPPASPQPIWKDEPLEGKTLLIHGEGGLGDHIINVRFAQNFKALGATVIVSTERSLIPLFQTLPYIDRVIPVDHVPKTSHDYWVPAMSAPLVLGLHEIDPTPYISRPERTVHSDALNVGIRWSGNPQFEHEQLRRFDPQPLIDLHTIDGVQVYSFQRDDNLQELPETIIDLQDDLKTWLDTQQWLVNMDVVVTSCTSIAHLSAAMGIPTWVLVPQLPYYVWSCPRIRWYDSATIYQQTKNVWPFAQLRSDVEKLACTHK